MKPHGPAGGGCSGSGQAPETKEILICQTASSLSTVQRTVSSLLSPHTHGSQRNQRGLPAGRAQLWTGAFLSFSCLMKPTAEAGRIQGLERPWMLLGASPREGWVVGVWRRESLALRECAFYHRKWRSLGEPHFLSTHALCAPYNHHGPLRVTSFALFYIEEN